MCAIKLYVIFSGVLVMLISQELPPLGRQTREDGKTSYFRAKCVNISKTVRDTSIVTRSQLSL